MSKYDNEEIGQSLESIREDHWQNLIKVGWGIAFSLLVFGTIAFLYLTDPPNTEVEIQAAR